MTGAVLDELNLLGIRAPDCPGPLSIELGAYRLHDLQIGPLAAAANQIGFPDRAIRHHSFERPGMVLDVEPVADIVPAAVDRQRLAFDRLDDG